MISRMEALRDESNHYKWKCKKGNTLTAIEAFVKGASEKNEIEIIEPDKLNIAPCKGCGVCQCSKGCVDKDDTNPTIDKIAAADMIFLLHQFIGGECQHN